MKCPRFRINFLAAGILCAVFSHTSTAQLAKHGEPECDSCKSGEYLQTVFDSVPPGMYVYVDDPPCLDGTGTTSGVSARISSSNKSDSEKAAGAVLPVANALGIGGDVKKILMDFAGANEKQYARCSAVCGAMPKGATLTAIRLYVESWNAPGQLNQCQPGSQCTGSGFSRAFPHTVSDQAVCVVVSNWSHNLTRKVKLQYWFKSDIQPVEYR